MPPKRILKLKQQPQEQPQEPETKPKRGRPKKQLLTPSELALERISKPRKDNKKTDEELNEIRKKLNLGPDVKLTPTGRISKATPSFSPPPKPMSERNFPKTKKKNPIPAKPGDGRYELNKQAKQYYQYNKDEINKKRREKYALTAKKKDITPKWTPEYRLQWIREWHKVNPNSNGSYDPAYQKEYRDKNFNKLQQYTQKWKSGKIKPKQPSTIVVDPPPRKKGKS